MANKMINTVMTIAITAAGVSMMSGPARALLLEEPHQTYTAQIPQYYTGSYAYAPVISEPVAVLPPGFVTIIVGNTTYYYYRGVFYQRDVREQKYAIVPPPVGAVVYAIPEGYQLLMIDGVSYYSYGGVYYKRVNEGYKVIEPPDTNAVEVNIIAN